MAHDSTSDISDDAPASPPAYAIQRDDLTWTQEYAVCHTTSLAAAKAVATALIGCGYQYESSDEVDVGVFRFTYSLWHNPEHYLDWMPDDTVWIWYFPQDHADSPPSAVLSSDRRILEVIPLDPRYYTADKRRIQLQEDPDPEVAARTVAPILLED